MPQVRSVAYHRWRIIGYPFRLVTELFGRFQPGLAELEVIGPVIGVNALVERDLAPGEVVVAPRAQTLTLTGTAVAVTNCDSLLGAVRWPNPTGAPRDGSELNR